MPEQFVPSWQGQDVLVFHNEFRGAPVAIRRPRGTCESLDESVAFDAAGLPLFVTLATAGEHLVADCTLQERRATGSALSLALDPRGRVCAVRGGGGFGVHLAPLADMLQTARQLAAGLLQAAQPAIERAAEESQSGGRDCAASFACT